MKEITKNWSNPASRERLTLVFSNRNKDYGAYVIRSSYDKSLASAFLFTCTGLALLMSIPALLRYFGPDISKGTVRDHEQTYQLTEVVLPEKTIPLPEKKQEVFQKPLGSTQQFSHLVVSDQDSLEKILTQEELLKLSLATKTEKKDSVETKPDPIDTEIKNSGEKGKVHTWVEEMPAFPGGEEAMLRYLSSNIRYPAPAREGNLTGTVYISFIVDRNGAINNIKTVRGIGGGCEEEAIRVIQNMPSWRPGKQNGQAVNVQYMLPVSFKLK